MLLRTPQYTLCANSCADMRTSICSSSPAATNRCTTHLSGLAQRPSMRCNIPLPTFQIPAHAASSSAPQHHRSHPRADLSPGYPGNSGPLPLCRASHTSIPTHHPLSPVPQALSSHTPTLSVGSDRDLPKHARRTTTDHMFVTLVCDTGAGAEWLAGQRLIDLRESMVVGGSRQW